MKLSDWKPFMQRTIDSVQAEVGMSVPALDELRARLLEADVTSAQTREHLEHELWTLLDSQPFLREATERYLSREAARAVHEAAAVLERAQTFLSRKRGAVRQGAESTGAKPMKAEDPPFQVIDVRDAIKNAESILPGCAAPEGESDLRWQAIMLVEDFIQEEPEAIWPFILRWGVSDDADLRSAIAVLLLEHLIENDFDRFFSLVEEAVRSNQFFADTFMRCWKLGQATEGKNAVRFETLRSECKKA